jgi:uncharacterized membrane protein
MSEDQLREYYEGLSDAAIRDSFVAGPDDFEPATWRIIREQMEIRKLVVADPVRPTPPVVERRDAFAITPRAAAEKRVEEGGTVALVLAFLVFSLGVFSSAYMRNRALVILFVCTLTLAYVITGILMRYRHSMWAAATAELLTAALYSPNLMYLARHRMWGYLAICLLIYGPPIYWFWRAYRAALALHGFETTLSSAPGSVSD